MKPKNFTNAALFACKSLRDTLDFYRDSFGFYEEWVGGSLDGGIRRDSYARYFVKIRNM